MSATTLSDDERKTFWKEYGKFSATIQGTSDVRVFVRPPKGPRHIWAEGKSFDEAVDAAYLLFCKERLKHGLDI